jgi:hypothetical protein
MVCVWVTVWYYKFSLFLQDSYIFIHFMVLSFFFSFLSKYLMQLAVITRRFQFCKFFYRCSPLVVGGLEVYSEMFSGILKLCNWFYKLKKKSCVYLGGFGSGAVDISVLLGYLGRRETSVIYIYIYIYLWKLIFIAWIWRPSLQKRGRLMWQRILCVKF